MNTKNFLSITALLFIFIAGTAQPAQSQKTTLSQSFNGAWLSTDNKGFSVMHDGYFNSSSQDSVGKWDNVYAGTYIVNADNTITFKVQYSSSADAIGAQNTAEYTLNGETLKLHHFKKLINANGKDITDQMPKDAWETSTRQK